MARSVEIKEATFNEMVLQAKTPVLVDFWAPRCMPCRSAASVIDELAGEYEGKVSFVRLNVDNNPRIVSKYSVIGLPTFMIFKNGQPFSSMVGFTGETRDGLISSLDSAL